VNKIYPTAQALIGDAQFTLQALTKELSTRTSGAGRSAENVASEVKAARDSALAQYRKLMASTDKPINPYRVYGDMMKVLNPYNSFVTHESGNSRDQLAPCMKRSSHAPFWVGAMSRPSDLAWRQP
jgi:thiamine pyrophosphate-dependent acetolactate synthase large subunit-like protein